jgi:hypothetical protein
MLKAFSRGVRDNPRLWPHDVGYEQLILFNQTHATGDCGYHFS